MPNKIDDIFKKAANSFETPQSTGDEWNSILNELNGQGYIKPSPSFLSTLKSSKVFKLVTSFTVVASISLVLWLTNNNNNSDSEKNNVSQNNINNKVNTDPSIRDKSQNISIKSENTLTPQANLKENKNDRINKNNEQSEIENPSSKIKKNHSDKKNKGNNDAFNDKYKPVINDNIQASTNTNKINKSIKNADQKLINDLNQKEKHKSFENSVNQNLINNEVNEKSNTTKETNHENYDKHLTSTNNLNIKEKSIVSNSSSTTSTENRVSDKIFNNESKSNDYTKNNYTSEDVISLNNQISLTKNARNQLDLLSINKKDFVFELAETNLEKLTNQDSILKSLKKKLKKENNTLAYFRPYFSADYTFYSNFQDSSTAIITKKTQQLKYTVGLSGGFNLWRNLYAETGILYSNRGNINWNYNNIGPTNNNAEFSLNTNYLLVPLKFKYYFTDHAFKLYSSIGMNMKFNLGAKNSYYKYTDNENDLQYTVSPKTSSLGIDLLVNAGVDWRILPELSFFIEPEFRYSPTPVLQVKDFDVLPYNPRQFSFGIGLGLNYKFLRK